ncbi:MAG: hypothetical protein ACRC1M_08580 [Methanobacteriaceae archaeon]
MTLPIGLHSAITLPIQSILPFPITIMINSILVSFPIIISIGIINKLKKSNILSNNENNEVISSIIEKSRKIARKITNSFFKSPLHTSYNTIYTLLYQNINFTVVFLSLVILFLLSPLFTLINSFFLYNIDFFFRDYFFSIFDINYADPYEVSVVNALINQLAEIFELIIVMIFLLKLRKFLLKLFSIKTLTQTKIFKNLTLINSLSPFIEFFRNFNIIDLRTLRALGTSGTFENFMILLAISIIVIGFLTDYTKIFSIFIFLCISYCVIYFIKSIPQLIKEASYNEIYIMSLKEGMILSGDLYSYNPFKTFEKNKGNINTINTITTNTVTITNTNTVTTTDNGDNNNTNNTDNISSIINDPQTLYYFNYEKSLNNRIIKLKNTVKNYSKNKKINNESINTNKNTKIDYDSINANLNNNNNNNDNADSNTDSNIIIKSTIHGLNKEEVDFIINIYKKGLITKSKNINDDNIAIINNKTHNTGTNINTNTNTTTTNGTIAIKKVIPFAPSIFVGLLISIFIGDLMNLFGQILKITAFSMI